MKYKVVCKIEVRGEDRSVQENMRQQLGTETEFVAYKIIAGLYVFYITRKVYEQGVQAGLIQPIDEEVPAFFFDTMLKIRGKVCYHRMRTALERSTPEYLRECLEKIERSPKSVRIRIYQIRRQGEKASLMPLSEICLDMVKGTVFSKCGIGERTCLDPFGPVGSHEELLDTLADLLDRQYMNSRDLYEQFARNDFYDVDKAWCERRYKLEFEWMKGEQNAVT